MPAINQATPHTHILHVLMYILSAAGKDPGSRCEGFCPYHENQYSIL